MDDIQESVKYNNSFSPSQEQLPEKFSVTFLEVGLRNKGEVRVIFNDEYQIGDIINDNSYENDYYRYHDIFHYTFAALLDWSPCTRSLMKRKRKSNPKIDEIEDGARATITEEAISMIIFSEAIKKNFFEKSKKVSKITLRIIKDMTDHFEVKVRSQEEWQTAILKAYEIFRLLIENEGGKVEFDRVAKSVKYSNMN